MSNPVKAWYRRSLGFKLLNSLNIDFISTVLAQAKNSPTPAMRLTIPP